MKNGGFKDIILEDVYDELCDRYQFAACPPANKQQNTAASKGGAAPRQQKSTPPKPPTPPAAPKPKAKKPACGSQPQTAQTYGEQCPPGMYFCTDAKKCKPVPEGKALTDSGWLVDMSESEFDFARCQRPNGTFYGTSGQCRKGTPAGAKEKEEKKSKAAPKKPTDFDKGGTLKGDAERVTGGPGRESLDRQIRSAKEAIEKYPDDDFSKDHLSDLEKRMAPFENSQKVLDGVVANAPKGTEVTVTPMGFIRTEYTTPEGNVVSTTFGRGSFNFQVNDSYDAGSVTQGRREEMAVARQVQRVFNSHVKSVPDKFVIQTSAHTDDGRGASRQRAYERMGFSKAEPGKSIYGRKDGNRIVPSNQSEEGLGSTLLSFAEKKNSDLALWYIAVFGAPEKSVDMSEYDFAKGAGTGKPCGGSHISASYECKLDAGERKSITDGLVSKGASKAKLDKLSDEQISRVSQLVKDKGLSPEQGERVSKGVEKLKEQSGGKKEGGANLQDPGEAKKYSEFYEQKKDLTYKAPYDTDPKVVKATMERLKEEDPAAYSKTVSALNGKGSPTKEQLAEAGWKSSSERGEAVLKSLMDNDFKDVMGQDLSWRQGLQLDHKQAGSTGGTDTPSNWIWISTATNQAKGGMEAAARKKGGSPAEKEEYIRQGLIGKLNKNAQVSAQDVAAAKGAGSARALAKSQEAAALRDNLPLMTPSQRASRISDASAKDMETVLKASVASGKNAETGRETSYRPVLSGGNGERVRKAYGTAPQMKAIARMRWDEKLSESDLRNIGGVLKASTGSTKSRSDLLNEMLGNFPRSSGLTAAERIAILDAAE